MTEKQGKKGMNSEKGNQELRHTLNFRDKCVSEQCRRGGLEGGRTRDRGGGEWQAEIERGGESKLILSPL